MKTLSPYLNFDGKTAEAMRFYQSVLGGDLNMQTFGEAHMSRGAEDKDRIVHAALKSGNFTLFASDTLPGREVTFGDGVHLSLMGEEQDGLKEVFDGLSKGGQVDMALAKQFWGDTFGMLTDKYGIQWMVNISAAHR